MVELVNSLAFVIFCGLVAYVCYWSIKNDDDGEGGDKRFHPGETHHAHGTAGRDSS